MKTETKTEPLIQACGCWWEGERHETRTVTCSWHARPNRRTR